jgi:hypothetical protein
MKLKLPASLFISLPVLETRVLLNFKISNNENSYQTLSGINDTGINTYMWKYQCQQEQDDQSEK